MEFDIKKIIFEKAALNDIDKFLKIIHIRVKKLNSRDYELCEIKNF